MTVEPSGKLMTSPLGVNTNTSSGMRSLLMECTKSVTSSLSAWFSSIWRIQARRSSRAALSESLADMPSLYFQWAAMPYSAVWCISQVRICTSKGMPSRPITVVWRDW